jgi:hypothetical protein
VADYEDQTVRIADLAADTLALEGLEFERCEIVGPAVIVPSGCRFLRCSYGILNEDPQTLFWPLAADRPMQGAVLLEGCSFTDCEFRRVGLALAPEDIEGFSNRAEQGDDVPATGAGTPVAG